MNTEIRSRKTAARRLIALASAVALTALLSLQSAPARVHAATQAELNQQLEELQAEEKELKEELNSTNSDLANSQKRKDTLDKQISNAKKQINLLTSQIDELDSKMNDKSDEIAAKEKEIADKEAAIQTTSDQLSERLRAIAKRGNLSSLQMVLNTEEYADYLIKSKMIERIAANDQQEMDKLEEEISQINEEKAALENDKQSLEDEKAQVETLKKQADAKKSELDTLYKALQAEIKKIQSTASDYAAQLKKNQEEQDKIDQQIKAIINSQSTSTGKFGDGSMLWPVPTVRNISSGFGPRWGTTHRGIDIANGSIPIYGQKVYAAADGVVIYANYTNEYGGGYGYYCIVDHGVDSSGKRISTLYAHNSKLYARVGDVVVGGQTVLSLAGDTGNVTGPHLHFEVRENGVAVDPIKNGYVSANR